MKSGPVVRSVWLRWAKACASAVCLHFMLCHIQLSHAADRRIQSLVSFRLSLSQSLSSHSFCLVLSPQVCVQALLLTWMLSSMRMQMHQRTAWIEIELINFDLHVNCFFFLPSFFFHCQSSFKLKRFGVSVSLFPYFQVNTNSQLDYIEFGCTTESQSLAHTLKWKT